MAQVPAVDLFFRVLCAGRSELEEMMALFSEDAVYTESFSGGVRVHRGKAAIRDRMAEGWHWMKIVVDYMDVSRETVLTVWTCDSAAISGGYGVGTSTFVIRDGLIARLEMRLQENSRNVKG
jgi:hypothetical protein